MKLNNYQKGQLGKEAKLLAVEARKMYDLPLSLPIDIYSILESQDAFILRFPSDEDKLSGFSLKIAGYSCVYVNGKHSLGRQNYSIAHELCHLLFDIQDDPTPPSYINDNPDDDDDENSVEYRANRFASYFLMPDEAVDNYKRTYIKQKKTIQMTVSDVIHFQHYFKVSFYAALKRMHNEKLIYYKDFIIWKTLSDLPNASRLQAITRSLNLPINLILPTNDSYVSPAFVKKMILNYKENKISDEKIEYLLDLIELPEEVILKIGGVDID